MINMNSQPMFIALLLAMTSCNGKAMLEICHVPRSRLRPSRRSNHARPESRRKTQIQTQCYTLPFKTHSVLCPRSSQPVSSPASVSPAPVSLSHTATAFTLTPPSRPHAPPSLLSTNIIKSYWATAQVVTTRSLTPHPRKLVLLFSPILLSSHSACSDAVPHP